MKLEGRVAWVTGGGSGLGRAISERFATEGARVAVNDVRPETAAETVAALPGSGHVAVAGDISDSARVAQIGAEIAGRLGRLDVLVNNAGSLREASLEELTDDDFQETIDVNLRAAMVCARAAVPHMLRQGRGRILSAASVSTQLGLQGLTAYAAAKAGIVGMTRTWARELGPRGITANAVAPGLIDGETVRSVPPDELETTLARIPARRLGRPDEVAAVYLFLASDLASFINGAVVGVDGGLLLY
jgi:3-oxoacyl-[acyl-carrier protein] reductase